jgi:hypothetical protein
MSAASQPEDPIDPTASGASERVLSFPARSRTETANHRESERPENTIDIQTVRVSELLGPHRGA